MRVPTDRCRRSQVGTDLLPTADGEAHAVDEHGVQPEHPAQHRLRAEVLDGATDRRRRPIGQRAEPGVATGVVAVLVRQYGARLRHGQAVRQRHADSHRPAAGDQAQQARLLRDEGVDVVHEPQLVRGCGADSLRHLVDQLPQLRFLAAAHRPAGQLLVRAALEGEDGPPEREGHDPGDERGLALMLPRLFWKDSTATATRASTVPTART